MSPRLLTGRISSPNALVVPVSIFTTPKFNVHQKSKSKNIVPLHIDVYFFIEINTAARDGSTTPLKKARHLDAVRWVRFETAVPMCKNI